ncbi:Na(+)/H(+) antiporter subunit B [Methanocaldococcus indicus]|uniref:Na(+)/H(+) antiporter subunit B n=1 Tax=Methanocaldococcus indicus TaxID=213231 RepID=UPI003C6CFF04
MTAKRDLMVGISFLVFGASIINTLANIKVNPGVNIIYLKDYIVPNYVTAILFDWRGYDTLGECLVLIVAVMVSWTIFGKSLYDYRYLKELFKAPTSDDYITLQRWGEFTLMIKYLAYPLSIFLVALGILTILGGHITPGGGFQGGALIASAFIVSIVAFGSNSPLWFDHHFLEKLETFGALAYIFIGFIGMFLFGIYLINFKTLFGVDIFPGPIAAGIIPYLNIAVGLKVLASLSTAIFLLSCEKVIIEKIEEPEEHLK